jgi:uncharacterized protein YyaL (SSP411 family)
LERPTVRTDKINGMLNRLSIGIIFLIFSCQNEQETSQETIDWQPFEAGVFDQAKKTKKLVLLEIGANWCHWCHVMDDSTYSDQKVQTYLQENFVLCREDQDERPDLYAAYKKWGWPAIVVFNENAETLLLLKGFQEKNKFLATLKKVVENPLPIAADGIDSVDASQPLEISLIENEHKKSLDFKQGGAISVNKSLYAATFLYAMERANKDDSLKNWADLTLKNSYQLVDPVWSGVYQYSAKRSWDNPHFEKLLRNQNDYIIAYSVYGAQTNSPEAVKKAEEIYGYCNRFLKSDNPLFYNSQNADLKSGEHSGEYYALNEKERLKLGTPSVDQRIYLKENAGLILALAKLGAATDQVDYVSKGIQMIQYILKNYKAKNGLFCREKGNESLFSLADNTAFLEVLMIYYQLTDNQLYLNEAQNLGHKIIQAFDSPRGLNATKGTTPLPPVIVSRDNLEGIMRLNYLAYLTKDETFKKFASETFLKLMSSQAMNSDFTKSLVIQAKKQLETEPFQVKLISNGKMEEQRRGFLAELLLQPSSYFIFKELSENEMTKEEKEMFGEVEPGTLFMCTSSYCSAPILKRAELRTFLNEQ